MAKTRAAFTVKNSARKNSIRHREHFERTHAPGFEAAHTSAHPIRIGLSTSAVFPMTVEQCFAVAVDLGYDGIEVMITGKPETQDVDHIRSMREKYQLPVISLHAPTLLVMPRVMGKDHAVKLERTAEMARELGAASVVVHPPFRWQGDYAQNFESLVHDITDRTGVTLAVENMFPWRAGLREVMVYLPHWDPVPQDYDNVTFDFSHAATAGVDAMAMIRDLGERLAHIHMTDGNGSLKDEHLVPGRGKMPVAAALQHLAKNDWRGDVVAEINTRFARNQSIRDDMLIETLRFTRTHLGLNPDTGHHPSDGTDRPPLVQVPAEPGADAGSPGSSGATMPGGDAGAPGTDDAREL